MKSIYVGYRLLRLMALVAIGSSLVMGTRSFASEEAPEEETQYSEKLYFPILVTRKTAGGAGIPGENSSTATIGSLPGGTAISVDITAPSNGAVKVFPPGSIDLEGTASVAEGTLVKDTTVVYIMDISGSMSANSGVDCNGIPGNDTRLVCEKEAVKAANTTAKAANSSVDQTGLGSFAGSSVCISTAHDVDLGTAGSQLLVDPSWNGNNNDSADIEEVASGLSAEGYTCYIGGLERADEILATSSNAINLIFFMSDGINNRGANVSTFTPSNFGANTRIHAFAMGLGVNCSSDRDGFGSLDDVVAMSTLAGGTCEQATDLSQLDDLIIKALDSTLESIERQLDGGSFVDISASANPPIPRDGPTGIVTFNEAGISAAPGIHELCARANGTDGGGAGSVTECIEVTIATIDLLPATATNELGVSPAQTHTVTAVIEAGVDGGVGSVVVNFEILAGPNAGAAGSNTTDSNGEATFTYTAVQGFAGLGTDVIEACFGPDEQGDSACDIAEKIWVDTAATIDLLPATATNELGVSPAQTHTVTAVIEAGVDGGAGSVVVNFEILTGPNAGAVGSNTTDSNGEATFTYTAVQGFAGLGTDVIEACFGPDERGDSACDTAEKIWVDTAPPATGCVQTVNPHGENIPPPQNEDGFFELLAEDAVDPNPPVYLVDTGTDNIFDTADDWVYGPFVSGTKIKYTEANGIDPPNIKPGPGAIDWRIKGRGDAAVFAVDAQGNKPEPAACLVPPPPK